MVGLLKTLELLLALSTLILIHEFGHFLFAKIFGIRVDKFYLFFDAGGFRLFSTRNNKLLTRLFPKLKDAQTDYGIGWLPLGGYCKISGMVDESMDREQLKRDPQPYEFRSHPAWQRLLVMFGGVLFNFIFAIALYVGMIYHNGTSYIPNKGNKIYAGELAREMGFQTGDEILSYDDYVPESFIMLQPDLARRSPRVVSVLRGRDTVRLYIDHSYIGAVLNDGGMFDLAVPFIVDSIPHTSPNYGCPMQHGDIVQAINGEPVLYVQDSRRMLQDYRGAEVMVSVLRGDESLDIPMNVDSLGLMGVNIVFPSIETRTYSFAEAIPEAFRMTGENIGGYIRDLKLVFTPSTGAYKSVGSFIAIGQVMPSAFDWTRFLGILAMLSIMLGVMNLIPIPGLDGGHIVITLFEIFTGHKPSEKVLMAIQTVGMILLLMLMFLAFGNDITRLLR
ncbi:MAG: RIP metalloprotease RseP [Bacteroidales bacterium]|nr:RIP metalloprotease RseP [Bacteroidales bacterium]